MGALSDLLHRANAANPANGPGLENRDSHDSQDSQRSRPDVAVSDSHDSQHSHAIGQLREALRQAATAEGLSVDLAAALDDAEVLACAGDPRDALRAFLRALARFQRMAAGDVPEGWTHATDCAGCGPVLLWREAPPAVIACPWRWHRKAGRAIPRPRGG
jgi:hypothetical protein